MFLLPQFRPPHQQEKNPGKRGSRGPRLKCLEKRDFTTKSHKRKSEQNDDKKTDPEKTWIPDPRIRDLRQVRNDGLKYTPPLRHALLSRRH
jgi:hypothetical protein